MSAARTEVLDRIRSALGPSPHVPDVPRGYRGADARAGGAGATTEARSGADRDALVALFCERVADYRATVFRGDDALATALAERGFTRLARAPGLDGVDAAPDDPPLSVAELDALDGVVTGCALAIAETGTIVLDGSPACGRRALTLVPDHHLCIVRADQIVAGVPDAIAALAPAARDGRPITLVSGPSATSDIELERVEGVHGPRTLDVVVIER